MIMSTITTWAAGALLLAELVRAD
jgi:hypothetical protein